ncbi:hypothetical protein [Lapidilactobacillus gannanensis]|uniref:Uncharacterized protein n=2 Tax=Lapidilactobacillus TaxID=2767884 RepID=A0ABW4BNA9_9LACO|nr:hypothetical protein [Lapidilactobacillus gannanensis]
MQLTMNPKDKNQFVEQLKELKHQGYEWIVREDDRYVVLFSLLPKKYTQSDELYGHWWGYSSEDDPRALPAYPVEPANKFVMQLSPNHATKIEDLLAQLENAPLIMTGD